jgi:hypothetical protein
MAICWSCGQMMVEEPTYTPKTHKVNGRKFVCPCGKEDKEPLMNQRIRHSSNKGNVDWGLIMEKK